MIRMQSAGDNRLYVEISLRFRSFGIMAPGSESHQSLSMSSEQFYHSLVKSISAKSKFKIIVNEIYFNIIMLHI